MPDRKKGLDGVDVSLWDVGDELLKYYGENKLPVHIAITPWGKPNLEHEYLMPAINNINKIANFQGRYYEEDQKPIMFAKTDAPIELQRIVEKNKTNERHRTVLDASEYIIESSKSQGSEEEIPIYEKPAHIFIKKREEELAKQNEKLDNKGQVR